MQSETLRWEFWGPRGIKLRRAEKRYGGKAWLPPHPLPPTVSFIYFIIYLFIHSSIGQETLQLSYSNQEEASRRQESRAYQEDRGKNDIAS